METIHINDIESAINYWRHKNPSPDGVTLPTELRALAEVYALLVFYREEEVAVQGFPAKAMSAWQQWYAKTQDTPCIAICSTSQGDPQCKGCGRTFDEVQRWTEMSPFAKRAIWRRISQAGLAWRFNRYHERAQSDSVETAEIRVAAQGSGAQCQTGGQPGVGGRA